MIEYRFAIPASLMFTVRATREEQAREVARRIIEACADGFDAGDLDSGEGDTGSDARVYCYTDTSALTLEDVFEEEDT